MKIEYKKTTTDNTTSVIISIGNKKYTRVQTAGKKESNIVWKNTKTNSLVNKERHQSLEGEFRKTQGIISPVRTPIQAAVTKPKSVGVEQAILSTIKSSSKTLALDAQLSAFIQTNQLLQAIKIYKEATGIGLKESKEYVDSLNEIYKASKFPIKETDALLSALGKSFNKNSDKKTFISEQKKISRIYGEIVSLREMSRSKGWNTIASKLFFDNFIK